jgi:predicted amidophosphoribosyltransferase
VFRPSWTARCCWVDAASARSVALAAQIDLYGLGVASLLDLLLPPACAVCGAPGPLLCQTCLLAMPLLPRPLCDRCGRPTTTPVPDCRECRGRRLGYATARAAIAHDDIGARLVHRLKQGGLRALAEPAAALIAFAVPAPEVDAVCWVPADRWRLIARGENPPQLIAAALARRWELQACSLLDVRRARRPQRGLGVTERRANVRDAFRATGPAPRAVCLVDDVMTTGATLSACANELRRAGATRVEAITLARAVRL